MGNHKQKWTQKEEDALVSGVEKHGPGKWKNILIDPQFAPLLISRSNIDLKDKWRNMNVSSSSRLPRIKYTAASVAARAAALNRQAAPSDVDDRPQCPHDFINFPRYNKMVFEAIVTLKEANGSDLNAIVTFIEEKHQVPQHYRRALTTRLRALVNQGKLEKVQNRYKIKEGASLGKQLSLKQKDVRPQLQSPVSGIMASNDAAKEPPVSAIMASRDGVKKAAETAAYLVADAEKKSYLAAEAVKEMEKLSLQAEESEMMLKLVKELYEKRARCGSLFWSLFGECKIDK